jgi:BSD domain
MDIAYDHITEETLSSDRASTPTPQQQADASSPKPNLNTEFQETFRAFSNSPWGAKLGGLWGNVRKQSEQYYEGARREVEGAGEEALKGFSELKQTIVKQTRSLSLDEEKEGSSQESSGAEDNTPTATDSERNQPLKKRTESELLREKEGLLSRFRIEAAKRIKEIEKVEDAADEALLRFGTNIRQFLRDAVAIAPPSEGAAGSKNNGGVLFESKDSSGKRVIHTTRFDAQLHVIHSSFDSFTKDPISDEWPNFGDGFKSDEKTEDISNDLSKYPDLRRAMEELVPEKVDYQDFWCRYYFLRLVIQTEEQKRKELLQGNSSSFHSPSTIPQLTCCFVGASTHNENEEEITWDADSDEENDEASSRPATAHRITLTSHQETDSTATISQQQQQHQTSADRLTKPATEGRKSNDQYSQPDSDASYDLVSGTSSKAPGSPKEEDKERGKAAKRDGESDEEDWE